MCAEPRRPPRPSHDSMKINGEASETWGVPDVEPARLATLVMPDDIYPPRDDDDDASQITLE